MSAPAAFYYDFNSPYACLAEKRIDRLIPSAEWRPIAFAMLLGQLGRLDSMLEEKCAPTLAPRGDLGYVGHVLAGAQ